MRRLSLSAGTCHGVGVHRWSMIAGPQGDQTVQGFKSERNFGPGSGQEGREGGIFPATPVYSTSPR